MKWKVLVGGTVISVCAVTVWRLYPDNQIISGIVMSIIAAYIFYFPIEFVPSLLRDYEKNRRRLLHIDDYNYYWLGWMTLLLPYTMQQRIRKLIQKKQCNWRNFMNTNFWKVT